MVSRYEVQRISDFAEIKTGPFGSALHQADYKATGTPIVTVEHLGERGIIHENLPLVGEEDLKRLSTYKCREGDILFSRVGSIDRNAIVKREEVDWLFSGRLLRVRVDRRKVDSGYLSQVFHTESFKDKVRSVAVGQTMPSLNTQILGGLTVNLPSLDEQKVVAGRLGSADQLIESLKRLASKKQAIKQGMMQELLTGRTRLQGFSKSWQATTFGDLVRIQRGSVLTRAQAGSGRIPVVAGGKTPAGYTDKANRVGRTITISASGASAGYVALYNEPIFASDCSTISSSRHYDLDFIYYSLLLRQDDIYRAQTGGAQPHIHACDVYPMEIRVPTDMQEQIAIAQVLVDADKEIMALERRLESARGIKQGMMQELLTGCTKLVPEGVR